MCVSWVLSNVDSYLCTVRTASNCLLNTFESCTDPCTMLYICVIHICIMYMLFTICHIRASTVQSALGISAWTTWGVRRYVDRCAAWDGSFICEACATRTLTYLVRGPLTVAGVTFSTHTAMTFCRRPSRARTRFSCLHKIWVGRGLFGKMKE